LAIDAQRPAGSDHAHAQGFQRRGFGAGHAVVPEARSAGAATPGRTGTATGPAVSYTVTNCPWRT
jgi:hypothetical protein